MVLILISLQGGCPCSPPRSRSDETRPPPWITRAASLAVALTMVACTSQRQPANQATEERRVRVVTTVLPITLFTRAVAGDCATVTALIQPNAGPHDVQAKPGDLTALRQARVLVKNGLGMEQFLDKLVASADNPELTVIDSSRNVATIAAPAEEADHGHAHGAVNPHIWLDPLRAVRQVEAIRDGLVNADPKCADVCKRNAAAYITQLRQLNSEIARQLRPYAGRSSIAFHDGAPYFAQRYGLKADVLVDVPEMNPSPADLRRVVSEVRQTQLKALLSEPRKASAPSTPWRGISASGSGCLTHSKPAARPPPWIPPLNFQVMRRNVAGLLEAFGG